LAWQGTDLVGIQVSSHWRGELTFRTTGGLSWGEVSPRFLPESAHDLAPPQSDLPGWEKISDAGDLEMRQRSERQMIAKHKQADLPWKSQMDAKNNH